MSKIIVLDWGIFLHRAVFATINNPKIPATFTCMSMIIGNLKRIGLESDDQIIVAVDGRESWRKKIEKEYKGDRKKKREDSGIDWTYQFRRFDLLLEELNIATSWNIIKFRGIEADDIMAIASRYYSDREIVLVTYDSDLEQCWHYENVKIFSPMTKAWKIKPKNYNVYKEISKKIRKEVSDNLVSPILGEKDYKNRKICVNLLQLPEWVEKQVNTELDSLISKPYRLDYIKSTTIRERMQKLYTDKKDLVDYNKQVEKEAKKKLKKAKKKKEAKTNV